MESVNPEDLDKFTVGLLKDELKARFLSSVGNKSDLIKRLVEDNEKKVKENIMEEYKQEKQRRISQQSEIEEMRFKLQQLETIHQGQGNNVENSGTSNTEQTAGNMSNTIMFQLLQTQMQLISKLSNQSHPTSTPTIKVFSTADTCQAIPYFSGKKYENASEWIKQVDRIANLATWSDNLTLVNASMRLRGQANDWHKAIGKNITTWLEWKSKLIERFSIKMSFADFIAYQTKRTLKSSETLTEYIYNKNALFEKSPTVITEQDKVSLILEGITDQRWAVPLATHCCQNVEQLLSRASALDNIRKPTFYDKPHVSQNTFHKHTVPVNNKFIPKYNPDIHKVEDVTCYRCKQIGHISYNCTKPEQNMSVKPKQVVKTEQNNQPSMLNKSQSYDTKNKYSKDQIGCIQHDTPTVTLIPVTLNDTIQTQGLPDSGSVITIIDKNILPRDTQVYPWQKGDYKVAGNNLTPIGWISARIQIGKIDYIMPQVAICDSLPVPMIIGKDWQLAVYARIIHEPDGKVCIMSPTHTEYFPSVSQIQTPIVCCTNNQLEKPIITEENKQKVQKLVDEYQDIFKKDDNDIGKFPDIELEIKLKHQKPISCKPYRLPERTFSRETIDKWIKLILVLLWILYQYGSQIEHINTTPYTPMSNSLLCERANATIMSTLTKFALENKEDWDKLLPKAILAINTSRQKTTKWSPFYLLHGYDPRIPPNEIQFGTIINDIDRENQLDYLMEARKQAAENISKVHRYNKSRFDLRRIKDNFHVNDYVLYEWNKPSDTKLTPRYKGPFKIIRKIGSVCYEIQDVNKPTVKKIVHVQFMKRLTTPHNLDSFSASLSDTNDDQNQSSSDDDDSYQYNNTLSGDDSQSDDQPSIDD